LPNLDDIILGSLCVYSIALSSAYNTYNAIRDWNSLSISIKNVTNKEAFKNAVTDFF
jgi:hypothetical protein